MASGKAKQSFERKEQFNPFAPITKLHQNMLNTINQSENIENQIMTETTASEGEGMDKLCFYPKENASGEMDFENSLYPQIEVSNIDKSP